MKLRSVCNKEASSCNVLIKWWTTRTQVLCRERCIAAFSLYRHLPVAVHPLFDSQFHNAPFLSETLQGARDIRKASKQTSSNIGIGAMVGGAIGAGFGTLLGPVGVAAIGSASAVVGGAIAKGVNVLKQKMIDREAKQAGIDLDED